MTRLKVLALCLAMLPLPSLACGMLVQSRGNEATASFAAQTVLVHRREAQIDLHVRMTLGPTGEQVSWVLPAPPGARLALGDDAVFSALEAFAAPTVSIKRGSGGGCSAADGAPAGPGLDVQVGQLGEYDYAVIASGDAAAVAAWLDDNGYAVPEGAAEALQPYADAGLDFIGVKLARGGAAGRARPTPLVLSVDDESAALPVYPLGLSALSAVEALPVVVYVLGPGRARVEGVPEATVADVADALTLETPRLFRYADAVAHLQAEHEAALFVTEAVRDDLDQAPAALAELAEGGAVLTRLYARVPHAQIQDLRLGWHPDRLGLVNPQQFRDLSSDEGCRAATGQGELGWLAALALFGLARRRRRA